MNSESGKSDLLSQLGEAMRVFAKPTDLERRADDPPLPGEDGRETVVFRRGNFDSELMMTRDLIRDNEVLRALSDGDNRDLTLLQQLKERLAGLGVELDVTKITNTDVFAIGQVRVSCKGNVFEQLGLSITN